jgi:hypothetical protein
MGVLVQTFDGRRGFRCGKGKRLFTNYSVKIRMKTVQCREPPKENSPLVARQVSGRAKGQVGSKRSVISGEFYTQSFDIEVVSQSISTDVIQVNAKRAPLLNARSYYVFNRETLIW